MRNKKILTVILILIGLFLTWGWYKSVYAGDKVTICHCTSQGCNTIEVAEQAISGHFDAQGNPLHEGDHYDACEVTITPTVTPTPVYECDQDQCLTPTPSPEPTESPEPTREPEEKVASSEASVPHNDCSAIEFTPTITGFSRLSATSVKFTWTNTDPINDYIVFYGVDEHELQWNVTVHDTHEVVLNDLPANVSIWASISGTDGVCIGRTSVAVDP